MSDKTVTRFFVNLFIAACVIGVIIFIILFVTGPCQADEYVRFRVTAYCPCSRCCGSFADGITASGTRANHPLVAAPRRFPFGTQVRVPGYAGGQWVTVEDRGGAITGNRFDLLFSTHAEALAWGVRWILFRVRSERW